MKVGILLFEDFETLDVFGPVEILGRLKDHYQVSFYSQPGGIVKNAHGVAIETMPLEKHNQRSRNFSASWWVWDPQRS
jgi:putative intracellular protease/amidase